MFQSGSDGSDRDLETEDLLKAKISPSSPVYKKLIAIHAGKPKGGLKDALKVEKDKFRRLSLAEQGLERAVENHGQDVLRYRLVITILRCENFDPFTYEWVDLRCSISQTGQIGPFKKFS